MRILPANMEDAQVITQIKTAAYNDEKKDSGHGKMKVKAQNGTLESGIIMWTKQNV